MDKSVKEIVVTHYLKIFKFKYENVYSLVLTRQIKWVFLLFQILFCFKMFSAESSDIARAREASVIILRV